MTIYGKHTKTEVNQLIAAKDAEIEQIANLFDKSDWNRRNGPGSDVWRNDWYNFNQRYINAKRKVLASFLYQSATFPLPSDYVQAEDEWQLILRAFNVSGTGLYTTGDFPDLKDRLIEVIGSDYRIDQSKIPEQNAEDLDLQGYKKADTYAKGVEEVPSFVTGTISNALSAGARGAGKAAVQNPLVAIGAALAVGVAGYIGLKVLTKGIL